MLLNEAKSIIRKHGYKLIKEETLRTGKFPGRDGEDVYVGDADIIPKFVKIKEKYFPDWKWTYGESDGKPEAYWDGHNGESLYEIKNPKNGQIIEFFVKSLDNGNNEYGVRASIDKSGKNRTLDLSDFVDYLETKAKAKKAGKTLSDYENDIDDWIDGAHQNESYDASMIKKSFRNFKKHHMMSECGYECDDYDCDDEYSNCPVCVICGKECCDDEGEYSEDGDFVCIDCTQNTEQELKDLDPMSFWDNKIPDGRTPRARQIDDMEDDEYTYFKR